MAKPLTFAGMLLLANALTLPVALGQSVAGEGAPADAADSTGEAPPDAGAADDGSADSPVDIEVPGGEIIVLGRRDTNVQRAGTQVISLLSNEDIVRTGEGDIAGALGRLTGLSVVGGGFVYVRGLGDRYSQALLNGSQLPSPEPLRRAIPLDLFPTDIIASSLVQKTYSANFPGEFGGGVINLTTLAIPDRPFFNFSAGVSGNSETTGELGYTHYGSKSDWTGFDNGIRDTPSALGDFIASGERLSAGNIDSGDIAKQFVNVNNGILQRNDSIPNNYSSSLTGGNAWLLGDSQLGVVATAGFSSNWRTRENIEQTPGNFDLSLVDKDYRSVATENRLITNGLLGIGYELGNGATIRWTNLYVHDTLKRTSLAEGQQNNQRLGQDFLEQSTGWYERELLNTQLTGSFEAGPLNVSARAAYATSSREAPFELNLGYARTNQPASPYGAYYLNRLDNGQTGFGRVAFSELEEDLQSVGVDVSADVFGGIVLTGGIDYANTERESTRREFQIIAPSDFPNAVALLRPDYLLGTAVVDYYNIGLIETTESDPAFSARLQTEGGYVQAQTEISAGLELSVGARLERGLQSVAAREVFNTAGSSQASTRIEEEYVLPAATLTYKFADTMQARLNFSQTIARPQFRELIFQAYYDPESNRAYRGNPLLVDSEFTNAEARYEWYFDNDQRFSVAGFYKEIERPIEAFTGFNDNNPVTSFANAPGATLYGVETELQKYVPLYMHFDAAFFASRRAVLIANYTYTTSALEVGAGDTVSVFGTATQPARNFFVDGAPLTGQSDHLVNLQIGLEDTNNLSQQTLLFSYVSDRVSSRGPAGLPDIYESPGLTVDVVARQGFSLFGTELEMKIEARNLFGRGYKEFQERGSNTVFYNKYDVGTAYSASLTAKF